MDQQKENRNVKSVDLLIIGFGISVIPLLRELDIKGPDYIIISSGQDLWDALKSKNRLDFDLVTSQRSSMFSFEQINLDVEDRYPTAEEFYEFIKKYKDQYKNKVINDWVCKVENFSDGSIVYTKKGEIYKAKHLVFSTGFQRKIRQAILQFDYRDKNNKTIVFNGFGDSVNMILARLIPYNNRIIIVTNGFLAVDKLVFRENKAAFLDQIEIPNAIYLSNRIYKYYIWAGINQALSYPKIAKFFASKNLFNMYPEAARNIELIPQLSTKRGNFNSRPVKNGLIAIKYWPIDSYEQIHGGENLEHNIQKGYLLNDITFFIANGLVELWPKEDTTIDKDNRTIQKNGEIIQYDEIVEGNRETPNLPPIFMVSKNNLMHQYRYYYRNTYMGIIPKELKNTYFLGFTRPTTGGIVNIIEMQGLFIHKMITQKSFRQHIYQNLHSKISAYNKKYYFSNFKKEIDHIVWQGFYTNDMAKLIGINLKLSKCRSFRDIIVYYFFPNNTFKYRQDGEYKVEGVKEMLKKMYYEDKKVLYFYIREYLSYAILIGSGLLVILLFFANHPSLITFFISLILIPVVILNPWIPYIIYNAPDTKLSIAVLLASSILGIYFFSPWIPLGGIIALTLGVYLCRKFNLCRPSFNDIWTKQKSKYKIFFEKYCSIFKKTEKENKKQA